MWRSKALLGTFIEDLCKEIQHLCHALRRKNNVHTCLVIFTINTLTEYFSLLHHHHSSVHKYTKTPREALANRIALQQFENNFPRADRRSSSPVRH